MNTTDAAKAIRKSLRTELNATSRQVSVRCDQYSMGSSIDVAVKDPSVNLADVKRIAMAYQHVDRCEITGEILNGGNMYVHCDYTADALAETVKMIIAALAGLARGEIVRFGEMAVWACTSEENTWRADTEETVGRSFYSIECTARCVATAMLTGEPIGC